MIKVHKVHFFGLVNGVRLQEKVLQEIQAFLNPFKQAATMEKFQVMKETITQYVVEPIRIYTKLMTLSNWIKVKKNTLLSDALELLKDMEMSNNIRLSTLQRTTSFGIHMLYKNSIYMSYIYLQLD